MRARRIKSNRESFDYGRSGSSLLHKSVILSDISAAPKQLVILSERGPRRTLQPGGSESKDLRLLLHLLLFLLVILSERGPRRTLQPGGGESKDLRLFVYICFLALCIRTRLVGQNFYPDCRKCTKINVGL